MRARLGLVAGDMRNMIETLASLGMRRGLPRGEHIDELREIQRGIFHLVLGGSGMGVDSVNRDICRRGVEVFALDTADLAAVNSIGKIGVEARKIKVIRTAANLLIGSEADAQRTVADVFVRVDFGAQGDYLGNAGFVVRAEQCRAVGGNQGSSSNPSALENRKPLTLPRYRLNGRSRRHNPE